MNESKIGRRSGGSIWGDSSVCGFEHEPDRVAGSNGFCSSVSGSLEHPLIEGSEEGLGHPHTATAFGSG